MGKRSMLSPILLAVLMGAGCGEVPEPAADFTGWWEGEFTVEGASLVLRVELRQAGEAWSGTIDIPQQQARGLGLEEVAASGDSISFVLPSVMGPAGFRGVLTGDSISGTFEQGGYSGTFRLARGLPPAEAPEGEEIVIRGEDCLLAGTLSLPEGEPPYPCVVLLTGSGLQDRDEYVMGFPVFSRLASILVPSGFAVLRCDDRGTGGSSGGLESFSDSTLVHDAGLMLDHLLADPRIDPDAIGLLGHSEGSTIAFMLAAARPEDVAFVVGMAGPAIDGYHLIPSQMEVLFAMQGLPEEESARRLEAQTMIMDAVIAGGDLSVVDSVLRTEIDRELAGLSEEERAMAGDPEVYVDQAVAADMASIGSPWFRSFLTGDPAEAVAAASCPVLALFGGLDVQVTDEANLEAMTRALQGNPRHAIVLFENANHLFQEAGTGALEEYALLEPDFVEGFADTLVAWVREATAGL